MTDRKDEKAPAPISPEDAKKVSGGTGLPPTPPTHPTHPTEPLPGYETPIKPPPSSVNNPFKPGHT